MNPSQPYRTLLIKLHQRVDLYARLSKQTGKYHTMQPLHRQSAAWAVCGLRSHSVLRPSRAQPERRSLAAASDPPTSSGIEQLRHVTEDGFGLELLCMRPKVDKGLPPLLFVHGAFHAAWCWAENFMPYFTARGFTTYAVSLRAQGGSDCMSMDMDSPVQVGGTLDTHCKDIAGIVADLPGIPILVGHSFGGLMLQRYASLMAPPEAPSEGLHRVQGLAFLASAPPCGGKSMMWRNMQRDLPRSLRVMWGFMAQTFATSMDACRELFFSPDIPQDDLARYQKQLAARSPIRMVSQSDVSKQLPLPPPPAHVPPAFVLGGEDDVIVDVVAVQELAARFQVQPVLLPNMAHDIMLDTRWEQAASELSSWLQALTSTSQAPRN